MSHYTQYIDPRTLMIPTNALLNPSASYPMSFAPSPTSSVGTLAPPPPHASLQVQKSASSSSSSTAVSASSYPQVKSAHQQQQRRAQRKVRNTGWRAWRAILPKPSSPAHEMVSHVGGRTTRQHTTRTVDAAAGRPNHGARVSHIIIEGWQPEDSLERSAINAPARSTAPVAPTPSSFSSRQDAVNVAALEQYFQLQLRARQAEAELERARIRAHQRREAENSIEECDYRLDVVSSEQGQLTSTSPAVQNSQPPQTWEDVCAFAQEASNHPTDFDFMHLDAATMTNSSSTAATSSSSNNNTAYAVPQTLLPVPLIPLSLALTNPSIRRHPEQYEINEARLWFDLAQFETRRRMEWEQREADERAERERRARVMWEARREARKRREREERKKREGLRAYKEGRRAMGGGRVVAPASSLRTTTTVAQQASARDTRVNAMATSSDGSGTAKPRAMTLEEREAVRVEAERKARAQELAKRAAEICEVQRPALAPVAVPPPAPPVSNVPDPEPISHDILSVLVQYGSGAFPCTEADVELGFSDGYVAFRSAEEKEEFEREMMEELERMFGSGNAVL